MGLLDRVARLVRANLNDLIDRAEDPQKMLRQVILDMQNQLMQVKTQVAISVADKHLLDGKLAANTKSEAEWLQKADLAVAKSRDDLARAAIEQAIRHQQNAANFAQQLEDQKRQVEQLKSALRNLEAKMVEAQNKSELLLAEHRRARALGRAVQAGTALSGDGSTLNRITDKVRQQQALSAAQAELASDSPQDELLALERSERIEQILDEIRSRRSTK